MQNMNSHQLEVYSFIVFFNSASWRKVHEISAYARQAA